MNTFVVHTEETEHSGDLARYAQGITRGSKVEVINSRYPLMGEHETGEITVVTDLSARQLQDHLDAQDETEGFCRVSRRG